MKKKIGTALVMAFSAGIGGVCGYLAMYYVDRIFGDGLGMGQLCLLFGALLGEKNKEQAEKYKNLFEKRAKSYPYPSEIQTERELMEIAGTFV